MRRRKRNKRQVRLVVGLSICLLLIMTAGYAAFSTNLTLTAKGNIKELTAAMQLKLNVVVTGDGLYEESIDKGRYVYRGSNPNNYIMFNGELWRIISIEPDGTLKILNFVSTLSLPFDEPNYRSKEGNTYCKGIETVGCSVWAKTDGEFTSINGTGTVTEDSSLNVYLNSTYYNSLSKNSKDQIVEHYFNYGAVFHKTESWKEMSIEESKFKWLGFVGLINISDYYNASSSLACQETSPNLSWADSTICTSANNYLTTLRAFTINSEEVEAVDVSKLVGEITVNYTGNIKPSISRNINPVVFLKPDIQLSGSGTEGDPYTIK